MSTGSSAAPPSGDASRERIIAAATALFADHGYDGTSTRRIAADAGLNLATVAYHVGGKGDLYREVMRRAHLAEREVVEAALADFARDAERDPAGAVAAFVDRYLDFCLAQPQIPALWMRRWLADAAEFADLEESYSRPLIVAVRDAMVERLAGVGGGRDGGGIDVDQAEMTVWTVLWTTHGFCRSVIRDQVPRFRGHLRSLVLRGLGLEGTTPQGVTARETKGRETKAQETNALGADALGMNAQGTEAQETEAHETKPAGGAKSEAGR